MARDWLTDEQVEDEISRLLASPHVKLARKEQQIRYRRRQYLYQLRLMEKKGKQLEADGVTMRSLEALAAAIEDGRKEE